MYKVKFRNETLPACSEERLCRPAACSIMSFNTIASKNDNLISF